MNKTKPTKRILTWYGRECSVVNRQTITTSSGEEKKCAVVRVVNDGLRFAAVADLKTVEVEE